MFRISFVFLFVSCFLFGCEQKQEAPLLLNSSIEQESFSSFRSNSSLDNEPLIEGVVDDYVSNLKDLLYGIESFITVKNGHELLNPNSVEELDSNPIDLMFQHLDVVDSDTGEKISVADMGKEELNAFIESYLQNEKIELKEQLRDYPELTKFIVAENEVYNLIKEELTSTSLRSTDGSRTIIKYSDFSQAYNKVVAIDPLNNSSDPSLRMHHDTKHDKLMCGICNTELILDSFGPPSCKCTKPDIIPGSPFPPKTKLQLIQEKLCHGLQSSNAVRGDILVTVADDGGGTPPLNDPHPGTIYSSINKDYRIGHCGILGFTPKKSYSVSEILDGETIEAWYHSSSSNKDIEHQVMKRSIEDWDNAGAIYVLGVRHWKMKWKWFKLPRIEYTPVSTPWRLADYARRHLGTEYSEWWTFAYSKSEAPSSFQCASLVWYCAKTTFGCSLAPYLSPTVTPSNILFSRNTYIKRRIDLKL